MTEQYDLIVIGAGSGGMAAAKAARTYDKKVLLIEKSDIGGTCVNRGCIPKKFFVYASQFLTAPDHARRFGWDFPSYQFTWKTLTKNTAVAIEKLNMSHTQTIDEKGISLIKGEASFLDTHTVQVNGHKYTSKHFLIATGTVPSKPDILGQEYGATSDDMFTLEKFPQHISIIGGGYIAAEFACIMKNLGAEVTVIYRGHHLLKHLDREISDHLAMEMKRQHINILFDTEVEQLQRIDTKTSLTLNTKEKIDTDLVLFATGRHAELESLNLEAASINHTEKGYIDVDDLYKTSQPHIFACGDIIHKSPLTPVAIREGRNIIEHLYEGKVTNPLNYNTIPTAIFSNPPIATCGLSESAAQQIGYKTQIFTANFNPLKNMITGNESRTTIRLVVDIKTDIVLGVTMIGEDAPEIIQAAAIAVTCEATKNQFNQTVAIHPTAAEELVLI